jgi:hypothetical protein
VLETVPQIAIKISSRPTIDIDFIGVSKFHLTLHAWYQSRRTASDCIGKAGMKADMSKLS